jgi:uncharacterized protein (UPF0212 family)
MSDPIKAALKAANAEAARRDAEDMDEDAVRRIIAAFLRELAEDDYAHIEIGNGHCIYVANFFWFAVAVERAAREGRDGS